MKESEKVLIVVRALCAAAGAALVYRSLATFWALNFRYTGIPAKRPMPEEYYGALWLPLIAGALVAFAIYAPIEKGMFSVKKAREAGRGIVWVVFLFAGPTFVGAALSAAAGGSTRHAILAGGIVFAATVTVAKIWPALRARKETAEAVNPSSVRR